MLGTLKFYFLLSSLKPHHFTEKTEQKILLMIPYDISVYMQRTKCFKYEKLQRNNIIMEIIIQTKFYMKLCLKY